MSSNLTEANKLCQELYKQSYHEIYGFDASEDELEQHLKILKRKHNFANKNSEKVDEQSNFLVYWRTYWNSVVVQQPLLCELYAICGMSQVLKDIKIIRGGGAEEDIRVHVCSIMPSGTGKSEANDVLLKFAKMMNLSYGIVDRYNDAVLVGSVDKAAVEYNAKKGYKSSDSEWRNEDEKGILRNCDIVLFDEGENILKTTPMTEGAQRYLQKAMNRYGSEGNNITNTLVGHQIGGYPNCSIVITSYYLQEFQETLLERGLLQRMIVCIQEEDFDRRTSIIDSIYDNLPSFADNIDEATTKIENMRDRRDKLINDIKIEAQEIRLYHNQNGTYALAIREDAKKAMKEGVFELRNLMPFQMGQKQIWESMITRMSINQLKVAAIHALINRRKYISESDARYASNLLLNTMRTLGFFLKDNVVTKMDQKSSGLSGRLKKSHTGEFHTEKDWINIITDEYATSPESARSYFRIMVESKKMEKDYRDKLGSKTPVYKIKN